MTAASPPVTGRGLRMTHAGLQEAVTDLCDWYGIFWWHDTDSRRNKSGLPDLLIIGTAELWRELKVPPDGLRPRQREVGQRMLAAGLNWAVWTPGDWRSGRIRAELEAIR